MRKSFVRPLIAFVRAVAYVIFFQSVITAVPYMVLLVLDLTMKEAGRAIYIENINLIAMIADIIGVALVLLIERKLVKSVREDIEFRGISWPAGIACVLAGVALNVFVTSAIELLPISQDVIQGYSDAVAKTAGGAFWVRAMFACLVAPVCEEIVFRGLAFNTCRRGMPIVPAVVIGAVVFGAVHGQILWISYAAFCGLFMILVFMMSGSLLGSILMHVAFNAYSLFLGGYLGHIPAVWRLAVSLAVLGGALAMTKALSRKKLSPGMRERQRLAEAAKEVSDENSDS